MYIRYMCYVWSWGINQWFQLTMNNVALCHGIQNSTESIVACHQARFINYRMTGLQLDGNRLFAQLLPGLETGHPVTVCQSPAYDFSVSDKQKAVFLVFVSDCSECICR